MFNTYLVKGSKSAKGRVGKKGELFPPKRVREDAGIETGDEVVYIAREGSIEVMKVPSLEETFGRKIFAKISVKNLKL
jgi:bifunctional DNA-binding transcriptional regulator/antitoxin component of YhaV-PrlF toxin-antitoxin module